MSDDRKSNGRKRNFEGRCSEIKVLEFIKASCSASGNAG